jgi:hypothetical protein
MTSVARHGRAFASVATWIILAVPAGAQTRVTTIDELRRALGTGDAITVVPTGGQPMAGRVIRLDPTALTIRAPAPADGLDRNPSEITLPLAAIQSLERPRDSARNGMIIGAGIGAGIGGAMFISALVIDRNEIDEWAGPYAGAAVATTAIGALIGWALDRARSKPHLRFEATPARPPSLHVQATCAHGRTAITVSISRLASR